VRAFAERTSLKLGAVAQPLRPATTGRTTSPGIFEVLAVLGKVESLARIAAGWRFSLCDRTIYDVLTGLGAPPGGPCGAP
jgi:hypothetical protein